MGAGVQALGHPLVLSHEHYQGAGLEVVQLRLTPTPIWGGSLPYCATTLALFLPCFCTLSTVFLAGSFSLQHGVHLVPLCYGLYGLC